MGTTFTQSLRGARIVLLAGVAIAAAAALPGCATHERVVVQERTVYVPKPAQVRAMPAPVREDRGAQPGPNWNWVPGHWVWQGSDWAWMHGKWVQQAVPVMPAVIVEPVPVPVVPTQMWVPGHWSWRAQTGGWVWVHGAWR